MNISDVFLACGEEGNGNMDLSLNYDNTELMSSEFFDSVLSLENDLEEGFLSNFEDDNNMSSDASHSDDVLSPESYYSESDKNSTYSAENNDNEATSVLNNIDGIDDPILLSFLDTITQQQDTKQISASKSPASGVLPQRTPRATKILIQNPSNKKCIAKPISNATLRKSSIKGKPQILKVQQITNNGRPVLLPLSFKSIKILNSSADVAALSNGRKRKIGTIDIEQDDDDDSDRHPGANHQYPPLNLNNEEKRLLSKEGIQLPSHYPLTKNEERELKRIRRKIRNKISAQDSRKRKKEYVDGLEERVKRGSDENKNLLQRVRELQRQNRTLIAHVNRLQALICKSSTSKATPSTCLMVVLLSALLVSLPNMRLFQNKQMSTVNEQAGIRRSLLSDLQATEDDLNMEEFLVFKDDDPEYVNKFGDEVHGVDNFTLDNISKFFKFRLMALFFRITEHGSRVIEKMRNLISQKSGEVLDINLARFGGTYNKNGFIEPDIDDYHPGDEGPPLKRARFASDFITSKGGGEPVVSSTFTNQVIKKI
ncbi:hypothetical protein HUJ05_003013 [Dendroctonus ponderosae]|nr:hypothetical protein HUJ05_003013 [Dendroctonus ponderosae]KAH1029857.1 hypothetical protein HUJ05_003013 [Dendroctonus ponderosae]